MLSQRLALYYLANQDKLQTEKTKTILATTFTKLDDAITQLLISDYNTNDIEETLATSMVIWQDVRNNKNKLLKQGFAKEVIYDKSDELTTVFNKLTLLYEKAN